MRNVCESKNVSRLYVNWTVGRLVRTGLSESVLVTLELIRSYGSISHIHALFPVLSGMFLRGYRQGREWFANADRCRVRQTMYVLSKGMFDESGAKGNDDPKIEYGKVVILQGFTDLSVLLRMYVDDETQLPSDIRKPHIEL